ncbi:hypothetical protein L209DRAFT_751400 [Thermothelomyces heterothallicus CBS 203.75]
MDFRLTIKYREAALRKEMEAILERVPATPGKEPGTGNIQGIGAERTVERVEVEAGTMELSHVSTRFPGPTTPRDFVTLIMMPKEGKEEDGKPRAPRQLMLVSRPCEHPDCPPRSGFIRGTYESVEVTREVPVEEPLRCSILSPFLPFCVCISMHTHVCMYMPGSRFSSSHVGPLNIDKHTRKLPCVNHHHHHHHTGSTSHKKRLPGLEGEKK